MTVPTTSPPPPRPPCYLCSGADPEAPLCLWSRYHHRTLPGFQTPPAFSPAVSQRPACGWYTLQQKHWKWIEDCKKKKHRQVFLKSQRKSTCKMFDLWGNVSCELYPWIDWVSIVKFGCFPKIGPIIYMWHIVVHPLREHSTKTTTTLERPQIYGKRMYMYILIWLPGLELNCCDSTCLEIPYSCQNDLHAHYNKTEPYIKDYLSLENTFITGIFKLSRQVLV